MSRTCAERHEDAFALTFGTRRGARRRPREELLRRLSEAPVLVAPEYALRAASVPGARYLVLESAGRSREQLTVAGHARSAQHALNFVSGLPWARWVIDLDADERRCAFAVLHRERDGMTFREAFGRACPLAAALEPTGVKVPARR